MTTARDRIRKALERVFAPPRPTKGCSSRRLRISPQAMEEDMGRWNMPAFGSRSIGLAHGACISSAVMLPTTVAEATTMQFMVRMADAAYDLQHVSEPYSREEVLAQMFEAAGDETERTL